MRYVNDCPDQLIIHGKYSLESRWKVAEKVDESS